MLAARIEAQDSSGEVVDFIDLTDATTERLVAAKRVMEYSAEVHYGPHAGTLLIVAVSQEGNSRPSDVNHLEPSNPELVVTQRNLKLV